MSDTAPTTRISNPINSRHLHHASATTTARGPKAIDMPCAQAARDSRDCRTKRPTVSSPPSLRRIPTPQSRDG